MKLTSTLTALALLAATSTHAQSYQTGLAELAITREAGRQLEGFLWYPTMTAEGPEEVHGNPVWTGITAAKNAEIAEGNFPFVVLSHGMYGNAMNQSWFASALAEQGYIVAAVNHPGTSTWLRDPDDARQMWERPKDVSRIIDFVTADPELSRHVNTDSIYMGGHSLGGFTAMALAGGRYDAAQFDGFCADHPAELVCGIFDNWQVAKTPEDIALMEADISDPRISRFAVFDLGGTQTFSPESLGAITAKMLVIGAPNDIEGLDLDIESRALMQALPQTATYLEPATLSHFDFLGVCKPAAIDILKEEEPEDVYVCQEGTAERAADHAMLVDAVTAFFAAD